MNCLCFRDGIQNNPFPLSLRRSNPMPRLCHLYSRCLFRDCSDLTSREGAPLTGLKADPNNPETSILNKDGKAEAWDWNASKTMEMDCFVCHLESPNNSSRVAMIKNGNFGDANTATLVGTGIVTDKVSNAWVYNSDAFDETGK